jgi:hypothetical protein
VACSGLSAACPAARPPAVAAGRAAACDRCAGLLRLDRRASPIPPASRLGSSRADRLDLGAVQQHDGLLVGGARSPRDVEAQPLERVESA